MRTMKRLLLGAGLVAVSAGIAAAAPAVVQTDLTLRSGPGPRYAAVTAMPAGSTVDVGECTGAWCQVAYGDTQGFANRRYLAMGSEDVGPGYGVAPAEPTYEEGYNDPGYYGDDAYYGGYGDYGYGGYGYGYGYPSGGVTFGLGGRPGYGLDRGRFDQRRRMGNVRGNNADFASRGGMRRGMSPQGNPAIGTGRQFGNNPQNFGANRSNANRPNAGANSRQSFGGNRSNFSANPQGGNAGAPAARSTVGAGGPAGGGPRMGGGGGAGGGGSGGARAGGGGGGGHGGGGHGGGGQR